METGRSVFSASELAQILGSVKNIENERQLIESLQRVVHHHASKALQAQSQVSYMVPLQSPRSKHPKSPKRQSRERSSNVKVKDFEVGNLGD